MFKRDNHALFKIEVTNIDEKLMKERKKEKKIVFIQICYG